MENEGETVTVNHQFYLNLIKNLTKAQYVGFETYRDQHRLKIRKNKIDTYFTLDNGSPAEVTAETYLELINSFSSGSKI